MPWIAIVKWTLISARLDKDDGATANEENNKIMRMGSSHTILFMRRILFRLFRHKHIKCFKCVYVIQQSSRAHNFCTLLSFNFLLFFFIYFLRFFLLFFSSFSKFHFYFPFFLSNVVIFVASALLFLKYGDKLV